jgi:hypothetical protein
METGAPSSAESKTPKTPGSRARAASSDGMPDIARASGRQGRSLTKEAAQPMRSRSISITRKDDTNKEVTSLFAKLDSESIREMGFGDEDEVSMFATLDAEFGDGSDGTAPTVTSSSNSAGSAGSDGLRSSKVFSGVEKVGRSPGKIDRGKFDPPAILKVKAQPLPVRKVNASNISMTPKCGALSQTTHEMFSFGVFDDDPTFGSLSQTTHGAFPKDAMPPEADSLSQSNHEGFSFGVFDDDPTPKFGSLSQKTHGASETDPKLSTNETPAIFGSCNSRESRSTTRDDEPRTRMKRSMSMGRRNKMRRSKSVGRRMSVEDEAENPSAGESPKSKQVSASANSRESRSSSRDGDPASKMRLSKSLGRRKPTGDEDSPSTGEIPKSRQVPRSSSSRESRPSSRDGDQASKMRRSRSVGRRRSVEDDADNPSARESPKSKQVSASPNSRESGPSSPDGNQPSKLRRSISLGRKKPTGDEDNPSAGESPKSKSRESRSSTRDDDPSSKMRRSKSTGRRMSSDGEGGAHAEEASRSRESRSSTRDDDQTSKMRRPKSTGRRMSSDAHDDVSAGEKPEPSESKPSRESRSSSRDDPSAPPKRSKSTARSKSKGPSQSSKEDPPGLKPKTSSRGGTRTVIRMSSKDLMEMGFDPANMPKSSGKSKGGRSMVPGLDAKDIAGRVLVKRKDKKKTKDESKDEEPVEEPLPLVTST